MKPNERKIVVVAHKPYWMPIDHCYVPIHVGATNRESTNGYLRNGGSDSNGPRAPTIASSQVVTGQGKTQKSIILSLRTAIGAFLRGSACKKMLTPKDNQIIYAPQATGMVPLRAGNYHIEANHSQYGSRFNKLAMRCDLTSSWTE